MTRRRVISDATGLDAGDLVLDITAAGGPVLEQDGLSLDAGETEPDERPAEEVAKAETDEILAGFKSRAQREDQRVEDATDSEYWIAVCFQTREQKTEFLRKAGWLDIGEKYLDGMLVALQMGIELESRVPPLPQHRIDPRLLALTEDTRSVS